MFLSKLRNKRNIILLLFFVSLLPMGLSQYGGGRGMQEISGSIALFSPGGFIAMAVALLGLTRWLPTRRLNRIFSLVGLLGIVGTEIFTFFTWHYFTITGKISLRLSLSLSYPEFWIGLTVSCFMVLIYWLLEWFMPEITTKP